MSNGNSTLSLRSVIKFAVIADVIWALMFSVLQGLILNQAGVAIQANGTATAIAAGGSAFMTFFQALFIGAVFEFFTVILLGIWAFAYGAVTKDAQPSVKKTINKLLGIVALCVVGFALVQSVTTVAALVGIGTVPAVHASSAVLWVVGVLSFILTFGIGLWQGMIIATIGGAFLFVGLVLFSVFTGRGKTPKA